MARVAAVRKFKAVGWHNNPGEHARAKTLEQVQREGGGRWYCPTCARKTHLRRGAWLSGARRHAPA